jgi:hypothetical protein
MTGERDLDRVIVPTVRRSLRLGTTASPLEVTS